jgi:carboxymethylenebutenolidase
MKHEVESHWQALADLDAFVACPKTGGPFPGVLVFQEIFGVNSHIRDVCARVAAHGYVAIAPDLFHRTARRFEAGYDAKGVALGRRHKEAATRDGVLADARVCIAALQGRADFSGAIGCVGFCFGGLAAFMAASLPEMKAAVSFYGSGIQNNLDLAPLIKGRLRLIYGEDDKGIPLNVVEEIAVKLMNAKVDFMVTTYSRAGHGFACDQRDSYSEEAAIPAWKETHALLNTVLRGG